MIEEQWKEYVQLTIKEQDKAVKAALTKAGKDLHKNIQRAVLSKIGDGAARRNNKYIDTLLDGVVLTKYYKEYDSITVHIFGNRHPKSQTYKLRFFESSNEERFWKRTTKKGKKTKPKNIQQSDKHSTGNLSKFNGFFEEGRSNTHVEPTIEAELIKMVDKINSARVKSYAQARGRE